MQAAAVHTFPESFTPEKQRALFEQISHMYTVTDDVLAAIQREHNPDRKLEMDIATPFITQSLTSANILSAFAIEVFRKKQPFTPQIKETMESALRNYYHAQREIVDRMYDAFKANAEGKQITLHDKAIYQVPQKTRAAEMFDEKKFLGTGGRKLEAIRQEAPPHQVEFIDAVWHNCSHWNGAVLYGLERDAGMIKYSDVNPAAAWGKQTVHAREAIAKTLNPKHIVAAGRVDKQ